MLFQRTFTYGIIRAFLYIVYGQTIATSDMCSCGVHAVDRWLLIVKFVHFAMPGATA